MATNRLLSVERSQPFRRNAEMIAENHELVDQRDLENTVFFPAASGGDGGLRNGDDFSMAVKGAHEGIVLHDRLIGKSACGIEGFSAEKKSLVAKGKTPFFRASVGGVFNKFSPLKIRVHLE